MSSFVIQRHESADGKDVHFDLMLEKDAILKTWTLYHAPDEMPNQSAVQSFDHRLIYLTYEGDIGEGRGNVSIWDKGEYEVVKWEEAKVSVYLKGAKLTGTYTLARSEADQWQLSKEI